MSDFDITFTPPKKTKVSSGDEPVEELGRGGSVLDDDDEFDAKSDSGTAPEDQVEARAEDHAEETDAEAAADAAPPAQSAHSVENGVVPKDFKRARIKGVFSCETQSKVGTGTTTRKSIMKSYWYAEEMEGEGESVVMIQALNNNNIPSGPKESVVLEDFLDRFEPEPEFYQNDVYPKMRELDKTLKRAESQRDLGAYYSAEMEFGNALDIDEENVRANFGLGLTYMERGEPAKASDLFERLVGLDAAFAPEHKHLFNEFGINLRKSKLLDQAVDYYERALEMAAVPDENLHYNVARAYFERGEADKAREQLHRALEIAPNFEEAQGFLAYLDKKGK